MAQKNNNWQDDPMIKSGLEKGIIKIKDNKIIYPNKKSYNFKDPEEKVRAKVFVELVEKYKYPIKRLDTEVYPSRREPKLPADIVVYEDDEKEKVFIVVETKADSTKKGLEVAKREGLGNANLLNAKYLLVVCASEWMAYNLVKHPSMATKLEKYRIADIPVKYGKEPKFRFKRGDKDNDLRKATFKELDNKFQLCHDEIWEGGKRDPATAFDEFSKILMAKIYDERFTPAGEKYKFQIFPGDTPTKVAERVRKLYDKVKEKNSRVFKVQINLPDRIIYEIVNILQDVSLRSTDLDVKGRAFEKFLGKVFRDEYGQYFTPRPVVKFMVEFLDPDEDDLIIDPACGSGGFLLYSLMHVIEKVQKKYNEDQDSINRISWNFAHKQIFGIEINDRIARIAMMDMIIHEDGHSNIECNNALLDFDKFDKVRDIRPNKYSIVFTNPPFGAVIKDRNILNKFELGKGRKSQKTEILFIERCLELLKEGGKLGIVIPDSILTNSTLQYVREYILKNSKILAVISLPQHAFSPSGAGVKASLLFLEKGKSKTKSYMVFMAIAKHIGFDSTGRKDSSDLPDVLLDWRKYLSGNVNSFKKSFLVEVRKITSNFSPEKHIDYFKNNNWEVKILKEITEAIFTGKTPARNAYTTEGYKIIKVRDLTGKGIDWDNEDRGFVSPEFFRKNENIQLRVNDILIISAAHHPKYIGQKVDIIDYIPERFKDGVICSAEILVIRVNERIVDPYYVLLYLKSESGYKAIQSCIRGQTAHIYPKDIKGIKIPIPPQNEYDKMKPLIEKLKQTLRMKTKANEEHRKIVNELMVNFKEDE